MWVRYSQLKFNFDIYTIFQKNIVCSFVTCTNLRQKYRKFPITISTIENPLMLTYSVFLIWDRFSEIWSRFTDYSMIQSFSLSKQGWSAHFPNQNYHTMNYNTENVCQQIFVCFSMCKIITMKIIDGILFSQIWILIEFVSFYHENREWIVQFLGSGA